MTDGTDHGIRRYSDLLTTGYIKTGADGRKILYPWGMLGYGFIFPTDAAYERLNDLLKIFTVVALAIVMPSAIKGEYVATCILFILVMIFYQIWMRFELRRLQPAQEKLTLRASYTNFARLLPAWLVWVELILCLVLAATCVATLMIAPDQWMPALGGIVIFGAGVVLCAKTLVLRQRAAREQC
jgi:hypothetical protein